MPRGRPRKYPVPAPAAPKRTRTGAATLRKPQEPSLANQHAVSVEQQTYGDDDNSTTGRLFPDHMEAKAREEYEEEQARQGQTPQETEQEGNQEKEEEKAEETPSEEPEAAETESKTSPTLDEMLDLDKFGGKKVKTKVDGQESEVTLAELVKNFQTDQHLGRKGNQVGEQRRILQEEMRKLDELKRQLSSRSPQPESDFGTGREQRESSDPQSAQLQELKAQVQQLMQGIQPTIYESARQRLANELKEEGFDDFNAYIPKIDAYVATVDNEDLFNYYNTPQGAKALYFQMKAKELKNASHPAPSKQAPERNKPPVVKVEGGSANSQGVVDDYGTKLKAAMEHARANPKNREAWNEVLRLKGLL